MKNLLITMFLAVAVYAGISTTTNIMPAQVCTTDSFTFTFPIQSTLDLKVITIRTSDYDVNTLTISTDYTVSATNNDYSGGGTVTTAITYGSGYKLIIYRDTVQTQTTTLMSDTGVLRTRNVVSALDKQIMISQDIQEQVDRSLKSPVDINSVSMEIPSQTERAGKYLAFNSSGQPVMTSGTTSDIVVSTFGQSLVGATDANAARVLLEEPNSIKKDGSVTYTANQPMGGNKITGYGTPTDENDVADVNWVKSGTATLKNKTLESPVITGSISGSAIDNDGNLAANSSAKIATEYATKKYVDTAKTGTADLTIATEANFVSNQAIPSTWTELSFASVVGSKPALIFVRVDAVSATADIAFCPKGSELVEAGHLIASYFGGGVAAATISAGRGAYLWLLTDTTGSVMVKKYSGTNYSLHIFAYMTIN